MEELKVKVTLNLTKEEFDILTKAINYYQQGSAMFEYGEHVEDCEMIKNQIKNTYKTYQE